MYSLWSGSFYWDSGLAFVAEGRCRPGLPLRGWAGSLFQNPLGRCTHTLWDYKKWVSPRFSCFASLAPTKCRKVLPFWDRSFRGPVSCRNFENRLSNHFCVGLQVIAILCTWHLFVSHMQGLTVTSDSDYSTLAAYQPHVPGPPFTVPTTSSVTHPP